MYEKKSFCVTSPEKKSHGAVLSGMAGREGVGQTARHNKTVVWSFSLTWKDSYWLRDSAHGCVP